MNGRLHSPSIFEFSAAVAEESINVYQISGLQVFCQVTELRISDYDVEVHHRGLIFCAIGNIFLNVNTTKKEKRAYAGYNFAATSRKVTVSKTMGSATS